MVNKPLIRPAISGGVALGGYIARIPMIKSGKGIFDLRREQSVVGKNHLPSGGDTW